MAFRLASARRAAPDSATDAERPPHPATVMQAKAGAAAGRPRLPAHPATLQRPAPPAASVSPRMGAAGRPPHPAAAALPPHPATLVQQRPAPGARFPAARPPHPATLPPLGGGRAGAVQPYTRVAPDSDQYPGKKTWGWWADTDSPDDEFFVRQDEVTNSWFSDTEKTTPNLVKSSVVPILVSDNGDLAIEATAAGQEAKVFFATMERVKEANRALGGKLDLVAGNEYLNVNSGGTTKKLFRIEPRIKATRAQGLAIRVPQRCNDMAQFVSGNLDVTGYSALDKGNLIALAVLDELTERDWSGEFRRIKKEAETDQSKGVDYLAFVDELSDAYADAVRDHGTGVTFKNKIRTLKANDHMNPALGIAIGTVSLAKMSAVKASRELGNDVFEYHWGTVVAKSGTDYVTIENYARYEGDISNCPLYFFRMLEIGEGKHTWHEASTNAGYFLPPFISFQMG